MDTSTFSLVITTLQQNMPPDIPKNLVCETADLQNELGFDSLGIATVAMELYTVIVFDLDYFAEKIGEVRTVSDLIRVLGEAESETKQ